MQADAWARKIRVNLASEAVHDYTTNLRITNHILAQSGHGRREISLLQDTSASAI